MLSRLASAQKDHSNRRYQHKNADDLKRQIVIAEKQRADIANVVGGRSGERWKRLASGFKMADNIKNLEGQSERNGDCAGRGHPVDLASCFRAKTEEHDDEKKKHHHRARINQHLNDADEIGIERHEESGEPEKRNDETERT